MEVNSRSQSPNRPKSRQKDPTSGPLFSLFLWVLIIGIVAASAYAVSFWGYGKAQLSGSFVNKAKKWNKEKIAEKLEQIKLRTKLAPSQGQKNGTDYMTWVSMTTAEEEKSQSNVKDNQVAYRKSLHLLNQTANYFPTLNLNPEYVPYGDSMPYCLNLAWNKAESWQVKEKYRQVTEQPQCLEAENPSVNWREGDTRTGVDFLAWQQTTEEIQCSSVMSCKMACKGVYKEGKEGKKGACYSYDVLSNVCLLVRPVVNVDTVEEEWEFAGGCYDDDAYARYTKGVAGKVYTFDSVSFEVRADLDPYTAVSKKAEYKQFGIDLTYFSWVGWLFFVQFLLGFIVLVTAWLATKICGLEEEEAL